MKKAKKYMIVEKPLTDYFAEEELPSKRKWYIASGLVEHLYNEYSHITGTLVTEDGYRSISGFDFGFKNEDFDFSKLQKYAKENFNMDIPNKKDMYIVKVEELSSPWKSWEPKKVKNEKFFDCWCLYGATQEEIDKKRRELEILDGVEVENN